MKQKLTGWIALTTILFWGCATTPIVNKGTYRLYAGIEAVSQKLIQSTNTAKAGKITVADFVGPDEQITQLGRHMADKLSVNLFSAGKFVDIMERRQLKQILSAHKQELSGYFDQQTVHQFGHLIGVDSMVIGKLEDLGSVVDLTAKVVHTKTGRILGMADIRILKDESVQRLLSQKQTSTLTVSVTPAVSGTVSVGRAKAQLTNGAATLSGLRRGVCQVTVNVNSPGYDSVTRSLNLQSRQETLDINLESRQYDVSFQIVPPGATLSVDGKIIPVNEQGFARVKAVSAKQYVYFVSAEGFENRTGQFNPAQKQLVMVDLNAKDAFYGLKSDFIKKVRQTSNDFNIRLWTNSSQYKLGDTLSFFFRAERDCYLNLVDINSRGELTVIFPNRFHQDNYVQAGRTYQIPDESYGFEFQAQPPAGKDRVYAIASTTPLNIFDGSYGQSGFMAITRNQTRGAKARGIGVKLKNTRLDSAAECLIRIHQ